MKQRNDNGTATGIPPTEAVVTVQMAARWFGVSRQAYYQQVKRAHHKAAEDQLVIEMVQEIRQRHPYMGGRKLRHELDSMLNSKGIKRGRDAFFDLLRGHDLLIVPKRSGHAKRGWGTSPIWQQKTISSTWRCSPMHTPVTLLGTTYVTRSLWKGVYAPFSERSKHIDIAPLNT